MADTQDTIRSAAVTDWKAAREKTLAGLCKFPEAGPGRWLLRDIIAAFGIAYRDTGYRDLRGSHYGVMLQNRRLVPMVGHPYGQAYRAGNRQRFYFAPELLAAVVVELAGKSVA